MRRFWAKVLSVLMRLLGKQPLRVHYFWSKVIKWIMCSVLHYRKDVIYINLARSFPEASYSSLKKMAGDYYSHVARIIVEAIWFGGCKDPERLRRSGICTVSNQEMLDNLYREGRSVLVMDSHLGNWELLGGIQEYPPVSWSFSKDDFYVVYKAMKNKVWDDVFKINRQAPIPDYKGQVESAGLLRHMLAHRDRPSIYLVNNDQYPYQSAVSVDRFLNQETTAHGSCASIAHKLGMAVLFMAMDNDRDGHYTISFYKICDDASIVSVEQIMKDYYTLLEKHVKLYPHNWLWSHKRWKNLKK